MYLESSFSVAIQQHLFVDRCYYYQSSQFPRAKPSGILF